MQALLGDDEVARVEFDADVRIDHYADTPELAGLALEIVFFEVSASRRRQGIGSAVVGALCQQHRERRFLAFSEDADDFWSSLGWTRHLHNDSPGLYRPLFIQPPEQNQ